MNVMAGPSPRPSELGNASVLSPTEFYLSGFEGRAAASSILVNEVGSRLPYQPCRYALLSNWNVQNDPTLAYKSLSGSGLYEDAGFEIYYGFGGVYCVQLFPSQNSGLLPISNLDQICVRSRAGSSVQLWYAWFW
jgi:hypothetical protein